MIIFQRFSISSQIMNNVRHNSIVWITPKCGYMVAISWALEKGDWWKIKDEEVAKFFSWSWKKKSDEFLRTALYIGRLAIVWQTRPNKIKSQSLTDF